MKKRMKSGMELDDAKICHGTTCELAALAQEEAAHNQWSQAGGQNLADEGVRATEL
jgi:hypothetical protein